MPVANYLWNPLNDNIVEEFDDAGNTIAEYTTEPDEFGDVISQFRDGQESFYHTDGLGSTLALTNVNGDVTDTYAYSAFGEVTARTGSTVNPFQYVGQKGYYWDAEANQFSVRRRPLSALWTRWLTCDPTTLDAQNPFLYVRNHPLNLWDPSGLSTLQALGCDEEKKCGGACMFGKQVKVEKCEITKLDIMEGSDALCSLISKALICGEIRKWIDAANEKFKDETWMIDKCTDVDKCDCGAYQLKSGKRSVELKDEIIDSKGPVLGYEVHCIMKVSGVLEVSGDGFAVVRCESTKAEKQ